MNTNDLVDKVATSTGMTKADARKAVEAVLETVSASVSSGEEVSLSGFGKFVRKDTAAREGRNPATGESMTIAAGRKVAFSPAKALKDRAAA